MTAERLREAAEVLRLAAEADSQEEEAWGARTCATDLPPHVGETVQLAHRFHAMWTPPVALALADWLEHESYRIDSLETPDPLEITPGEVRRSTAVADAILGEG